MFIEQSIHSLLKSMEVHKNRPTQEQLKGPVNLHGHAVSHPNEFLPAASSAFPVKSQGESRGQSSCIEDH